MAVFDINKSIPKFDRSAQALLYWLARRRWTTLKFADEVGVTEQAVLNWIEGKCNPHGTNRARIEKITGIEWEAEATSTEDEPAGSEADSATATIKGLTNDLSSVKTEMQQLTATVAAEMQQFTATVANLVLIVGAKAVSTNEVPRNVRDALHLLGDEMEAAQNGGSEGSNGARGAKGLNGTGGNNGSNGAAS